MSRVWSLLFACAFCLCCSGSLPGQGLHGLSPPMNLSVKSHNFHTVLKWAVVDASRTSRFNIDTSNYSSGIWKPYPPCFNISTHHCDLSDAFKLTLKDVTIYYARVKAVTTSQESAFAYTYGFTFKNNATLGPPTVHLAANGNEIAIEVKYEDPNSTESIKNALKNLAYNIYCWKPEDPKSESKKICSRQNRHPKITVTEGVTCVSAEVHLNKLQLKGERSQETCLLIQSNKHNLSDSRTFSWSPTLRRETYTIPQTPELEYSGKEGEEEYEDYPWSNDCLGNEESPGNEYYQNEYYQNEYYQEEMDAEEDEDPKDTSDELEHGTSHKFQPVNTEFSKGKIVAVLATVGVVLFMIGIIYFACNFNKKELLPKSLVHIITGGRAYTNVNVKAEETSPCVVTPLEEVVINVCEVDLSAETPVEMIKTSSDNIDADPVNVDVGHSEPVNADLNDPYAAKIGNGGTNKKSVDEDDIEVGNSDLDSTHALWKTSSDDMKQIAADNWGYDKPQICS